MSNDATLDVIDVQSPQERRLRLVELGAAVAVPAVGAVLAVAGWYLGSAASPALWAALGGLTGLLVVVVGVPWRAWRQDYAWLSKVLDWRHAERLMAAWVAAVAALVIVATVLAGAGVRLVWDLALPWWLLVLIVCPFVGAVTRLRRELPRLTEPARRWHGIVLRRLEERAATHGHDVEAVPADVVARSGGSGS